MIDPLTPEARETLQRIGRADLIRINEIVAAGRGAWDAFGKIVSLDDKPDAEPVNKENQFQRAPKPKKQAAAAPAPTKRARRPKKEK